MAEKSIILRLSTFSDDAKTQLRIIGLLALTYRASLDTLMKLFPSLPKEPEKLFDLLIYANYSSDYHQQGLKFLVSLDILPDQNEAAKRIYAFHEYWKQMNQIQDPKEKNIRRSALWNIITSAKAYGLLMEYKNGRILTDDEFVSTIQYHLKYALTYDQLSDFIGKSNSGYVQREQKLVKKYPYLEAALAKLAEFNKIKGDNNWKYLPEANGGRKS